MGYAVRVGVVGDKTENARAGSPDPPLSKTNELDEIIVQIQLLFMQVLLGMIAPLGIMVSIKLLSLNDELRRLLYFVSVLLIQLGIFSTRWNVVIGGQMFSKSLMGLTTYKMEIMGLEGLLTAVALLMLPFLVLAVLIKILPPWDVPKAVAAETA